MTTRTCAKDCCQEISAYYIQPTLCCSSDNEVANDDAIDMDIDFRFLAYNSSLQTGRFAVSPHKIATFKIGSNIQQVTVDWTAITTSSPMIPITGVTTVPVINSQFSITVPSDTTDLKVDVSVNNVTLTAVVPVTSPMNKFSAEDLILYMMFKYANKVAIDTSGLDHTPLANGDTSRVFGHQLGPHRSSRAMAIVHIAIFDSIIASLGAPYTPYSYTVATPNASPLAAIAQATYDTLVYLFPSHAPRLSGILTNMLATIDNGAFKNAGIALGSAAASSIIAVRTNDNSNYVEQVIGTNYPVETDFGVWTDTPGTKALGSLWPNVTPFAVAKDEVTIQPFPDFSSREYAMAFNQVKSLGGDGDTTPTIRSQEETNISTYWAYDGTPSLCAPPRLYNELIMQILSDNMSSFLDMVRGICLINVGLADTAIACWYRKYQYKIWRPKYAMRDARTTGINAETIADPTWTALGAPASNGSGPNFTPPFPTFPSGHASFGGTLFQLLRTILGTDNIPFTFTSDELNGSTLDNNGQTRPLLPRSFINFTQAEDENGFSRLPLGIHFYFDKTQGIALGNGVATLINQRVFTPR